MKARVAAILATATTLALLNTLVLTPGAADVYASDVFGSLRLPGDAAFIAGHRGDRSVAPRTRCRPSPRRSRTQPMQFVETDVQLSRDGVPMLFHDATLKRVAGVAKRVGELSHDRIEAARCRRLL